MSTDLDIPAAEVAPATLFRSDDPGEIVARASALANELATVVRKQGLTAHIQGKDFPKVEAWTLCGTMLGVFPVCVWTRQVKTADGSPHGWEAKMEARTRDGDVVGSAEAQCLRDEDQWGWHPKDRNGKPLKPRDDFALRSMAQTRATSKALRLPLGFVMTLAGFEATPAEEMPNGEATAAATSEEPKATGPQIKKCHALVDRLGRAGALAAPEYAGLLTSRFGTSHFSELSKSQASVVIDELEAMERDADIPF